jgi:hypothetical protein
VLANPVGSNHPPLLLKALHSLETIISNCWPRISNHHVEILRGTVTCWRYLRNQDAPDLVPVREGLIRVVKLLKALSPEAEIDTKAIASIDSYFEELCGKTE